MKMCVLILFVVPSRFIDRMEHKTIHVIDIHYQKNTTTHSQHKKMPHLFHVLNNITFTFENVEDLDQSWTDLHDQVKVKI